MRSGTWPIHGSSTTSATSRSRSSPGPRKVAVTSAVGRWSGTADNLGRPDAGVRCCRPSGRPSGAARPGRPSPWGSGATPPPPGGPRAACGGPGGRRRRTGGPSSVGGAAGSRGTTTATPTSPITSSGRGTRTTSVTAGWSASTRLHLHGVHVVAAPDEHLLGPAHQVEPSPVVQVAEVAGAHRAVGPERGGGRHGVTVVAGHDGGGPQAHLTDVAGRDGGAPSSSRMVSSTPPWARPTDSSASSAGSSNAVPTPIPASVQAYRTASAAPSRSRASRTRAGVAGPPPITMAWTQSRSNVSSSGRRSIRASWVGMPARTGIRCSAVRRRASSARHRPTRWVVPPRCRLPASLVVGPRWVSDVPARAWAGATDGSDHTAPGVDLADEPDLAAREHGALGQAGGPGGEHDGHGPVVVVGERGWRPAGHPQAGQGVGCPRRRG